jgi:hypothetical protein
VLQRIRLWSLLDDGTSGMAHPGLAEHGYLFMNQCMLHVQSEYVNGVLI